MTKLWSARLARHAKAQSRYLQRVFNDHFVLVLLILMGGLLYAYSGFVRQIPVGTRWYALLVAALLAFSLPIGRLATLLEPADATFLLPRLAEMRGYLTRALRYSLVLPITLQFLLTLAAYPLLGGDFFALTCWVVAQIGYKVADMYLQRATLYQVAPHRVRMMLIVVACLGNLVSVLTHPVMTLVLALLIVVGVWQLGRRQLGRPLDLTLAIQLESDRMTRIYRFYNLFTDVPGLGGGTHRRGYLDALLTRIPQTQENTWRYLYARGLLRSEAYGSLSVRLTVMGALMVFLVKDWWLALGLGVLFIYLLGVQLVPLAMRYDEIVFTHLYPVARQGRVQAWTAVVAPVLLVQALVIGVTNLLVHLQITGLGVLVALLICAIALPRTILVARVRKNL